jgi:hypothetical protein
VIQGKKKGLKHEWDLDAVIQVQKRPPRILSIRNQTVQENIIALCRIHPPEVQRKFSLMFLAFTHANYLLFGGFGLFVSGLAWF